MKIVRPIVVTDSVLLSTNVAETDHAAWVIGTTYSIGDKVIVVATHRIYEALISASGKYPPDYLTGATPYWLDIGATNAHKMFDGVVGVQTSNADTIEVSLLSSGATTLSLMNIDAASVTIVVTDPADGEVYNNTIDLISTSNVVDAFSYFFEPFLYTKNLITYIPPYSGATVDVTVDFTGETAKCGEMVIGTTAFLGCTQFGASVGITSYSVKTVDDFGNFTILPRAFAKRGDFDIVLDNSQMEFVLNTLIGYTDTAVIWIPTDAQYLSSPLVIYGFYKSFSVVIPYAQESSCSIEVEGLT